MQINLSTNLEIITETHLYFVQSMGMFLSRIALLASQVLSACMHAEFSAITSSVHSNHFHKYSLL